MLGTHPYQYPHSRTQTLSLFLLHALTLSLCTLAAPVQALVHCRYIFYIQITTKGG